MLGSVGLRVRIIIGQVVDWAMQGYRLAGHVARLSSLQCFVRSVTGEVRSNVRVRYICSIS